MAWDADDRIYLSNLARDRAWAMAFSNGALLALMLLWWLPSWPDGQDFSKFVVCETIVIVVTMVLNPRDPARFVVDLLSSVGRAFTRGDPQPSSKLWEKIPQIGNHPVVLFGLLLPSVVIDLYGIGWLVNRTGGITGSPFAQIPFFMIALGMLMADKPETITGIAGFGAVYVFALTKWDVMGPPTHGYLSQVSDLETIFVAVTLLSLTISYLVNLVARPSRRLEFRVVLALYGVDSHWVDVTEIVRQQVTDNRLSLTAGNALFGDPAPNQVKRLSISYEVGGRPFKREYGEGVLVELPAPLAAPVDTPEQQRGSPSADS
jgi:hypothetical protein